MRKVTGYCCVLMVLVSLASTTAFAADKASIAEAKHKLSVEAPSARLHEVGGMVTRAYGTPMAFGSSPEESAAMFVQKHTDLFGGKVDDLSPESFVVGEYYATPVMYQKDTGEYKFTLVRYQQYRGEIPVFRADLRVLVLNRADYPVVWAGSSLRDLSGLGITPESVDANFDPAVTSSVSGMTRFSKAMPVIFAGANDVRTPARLGYEFVGENDRTDDGYEAYLFVCDAATNEILHQETLIHFVDVQGSVQAMATPGAKADICTAEIMFDYSHARVQVQGGSSVYADRDGNFVIPNGGSSPVTVVSYVDGLYFSIDNWAGSEETLYEYSVTPPGNVTITHNAANDSDLVRSQVNVYLAANVCRDWLLDQNPSFPGVGSETGVPAVVNRTDIYCPCNAWSSSADGSINFCQAGGGCPNTGWQSVINHEYGHHCIDFTSSGQGEYGEGISDCFSMLPVDDPNLGYGFSGDCNSGLRTADNDCQYSASSCSSCGSEVHECGQLLSGCVWDIRNQMLIVEPADYLEILSNIVVNSILLHTGTSIDNQIPIDFLTLDDNDGNIDNGTPHYSAICTGFDLHGLECPEIQSGLSVSPNETFLTEGPSGGPFLPASKIYTLQNMGPGSINYSVSSSATWLTITGGSGTLANVGDTAQVTVAVNANANTLPDGRYLSNINIVNLTDHAGDTTRSASLGVGVPVTVYEWNMNTNPGWTTEGDWAYGQPTGGGGEYGNEDPTSGYTGNNVYGYNLNGDYGADMAETHLTSTAIDCTGLTDVTLRFYRYLNVETPQYDHAYVRVSNNGSSWTTIWENTAQIEDDAWSLQEFDISSIADGQPTVYLRWTMGTTDGSWFFSGWNIDDISIKALGGEQPPLTISLPSGVPNFVEPNQPTNITVQINDGEESYVPGSGTLHYRFYGGAFSTATLVHQSGNLYTATVPAAACDATPEFYFSAQGDGGSTVLEPADAPGNRYSFGVGSFEVMLEDNFESDLGWTVSDSAGLAEGTWERGIPVNNDRGDPPSDYDGSGRCYLTENDPSDTNSDVDDGYTWLMSPTLDMDNGGTIEFAVWYTNNEGDDPNNDLFNIHVSNDNGSNWTLVETVGPATSAGWTTHSFEVEDYVTPTSQVKVRFEASDLNDGSIVEAGIDAVSASSFTCEASATCDDGILNQGEDKIDCGGPCPACDCVLDGECNDYAFCTGTESCDDYGHCVAGTYPCGSQMCDEVNDACVDCIESTDCPDDGVDCTDRDCVGGNCVYLPVDAYCDDGQFCNGEETCDAISDCQAGVSPCDGQYCSEANDTCVDCLLDEHCPDDSVDCTETRCEYGFCTYVPVNEYCDDGSFCNGEEYCDEFLGCQNGSYACGTTEWCSEDEDDCIALGDGDFDDDGDVDLIDFAEFMNCFGTASSGACLEANLFGTDGAIDLDDFSAFVPLMDGPQ